MSPLFDQDAPDDGRDAAAGDDRFDGHDDEFVDLPPERRTLPKVAAVLVVLVAVLGIGAFLAKGWYDDQIDPPGEAGAPVVVDIPAGTTTNGLGTLLADEGVIGNATVFRFWVRDRDVNVQAGSHNFRLDSSFDEVLDVVEAGPAPPPVTRVTVPEGYTLRQMRAALAEADDRFTPDAFDAALADPALTSALRPAGQTSWEGLLFPSTYEVGTDDGVDVVVGRMAAQMEQVAAAHDLAGGVRGGAQGAPALSPYEILTVASLIEEETGNPGESAKIARVIYNRLQQGIPLGIDATSKYLAEQTGTEIDFESDSPYNTRRQQGLPPTPISAPGEASIAAALAPADGPWIYYVLEAPGQHFFTDSEAEFLEKKQECEDEGLGCG